MVVQESLFLEEGFPFSVAEWQPSTECMSRMMQPSLDHRSALWNPEPEAKQSQGQLNSSVESTAMVGFHQQASEP